MDYGQLWTVLNCAAAWMRRRLLEMGRGDVTVLKLSGNNSAKHKEDVMNEFRTRQVWECRICSQYTYFSVTGRCSSARTWPAWEPT